MNRLILVLIAGVLAAVALVTLIHAFSGPARAPQTPNVAEAAKPLVLISCSGTVAYDFKAPGQAIINGQLCSMRGLIATSTLNYEIEYCGSGSSRRLCTDGSEPRSIETLRLAPGELNRLTFPVRRIYWADQPASVSFSLAR